MSNRNAAALCAFIVLLAAPFAITSTFYIGILTQVLIFAIFALGLNVLVGYGGLVSLGHAGIFGMAAYAGALMLDAGHGQLAAALAALLAVVATSAVYAVISLRASGIAFIMITLALGQILWGLAYRWASLTNGETGIAISAPLAPAGVPLASASQLYFFVLIAFALCVAAAAIFANSNLGISLVGARDQPRRMSALGYNVWMIRFLAYMFSGLLSGVAGFLFLFYNQFIGPQSLAITASAEVLLMVISGGAGTLIGPITGAVLVVIMKDVASAYIERWNLMLGVIFVLIVIFMPEGFAPGLGRVWTWTLGLLRVRRAAPDSLLERR